MKLIIWELDNVNDRGAAMIIDCESKMMLMIGKPLNWPRVQIYFSTLCHNPTRRQRGSIFLPIQLCQSTNPRKYNSVRTENPFLDEATPKYPGHQFHSGQGQTRATGWPLCNFVI